MSAASVGLEWRKVLKGLALFCYCWLLASLVAAGFVSMGWGYWLELLNGATWPTAFATNNPPEPRTLAFYVVLGLRTVLNLGAVLSALFAVYWLLTGGLEKWLMGKIDLINRSSNIALTAHLLKLLEERGVVIPDKVEAEMMTAARDFPTTEVGKHFDQRRQAVETQVR